jgi:hypothetical protein
MVTTTLVHINMTAPKKVIYSFANLNIVVLWSLSHPKKGYNPIAMQDYSLQKFDHIDCFVHYSWRFWFAKKWGIALPTSQRQVQFPREQGTITMNTCTTIIHGFSSY